MNRVSSIALCATALLAVAAGGCGEDERGPRLGDRTIHLDLTYYVGSNWGPTDATGTAVIVTRTGQVDIEVFGLPQLDGEVYEGWLANGGETPVTTGRFNTDADGHGRSSITLGDITRRTYITCVLTVEPEPDPSTKPDPRHSIGSPIPPP